MIPFAIKKLSVKQHPKYEKTNFAEFPLVRKLVGFYRFSDETLIRIVNELNLSLSINAMKHLQKYFYMGNPPSILSLKIIDKFWASGYGCLNREISQIEIATDNPHVFRALTLYNDLREKYNLTSPRTLNNIFSISALISDDEEEHQKTVTNAKLECECYERGEKTHYFTDIITRWNDDENGALHRAAVESIINGGSPFAAIREEIGGFTAERVRVFAEYAEDLDLSVLGAHGEYNTNTLVYPANKASVLNYFGNSAPYSGDLIKGDKIYMLTFPNTDGSGMRTLKKFIDTCIADKIIVRAFSTDGGILRGLVNEEKGFDIILSESLAKDPEQIILGSQLNRIIVVVHSQNSARVMAYAEKFNFPCSLIGRITEKPFMRLFISAIEISKLTFSLLKYRTNEFCVARISGRGNDDAFPKQQEDDTELLKRNLSYAINEVEYALNGINSGKNVLPPFFGANQATPAQAIAISPCPNRFDNVANVMAVSATYGASNTFVNTVNTILSAVMKLVIGGVSIYDIAINTNFLFIQSDNRNDKGRLLEIALASLYVENALSLANLSSTAECAEILDGVPVFTATATGYTSSDLLVPPVFKKGDKIFRLGIPRDEFGMPDIKYILKLAAAININISTGNITAARLIEGSVIKGVLKGTAGNNLGFSCVELDDLGLKMAAGDLLLAIENIEEWSAFDCEYVGVVDDSGILRNMDMSFARNDVNVLATKFELADKPDDRVHIAPVTVRVAEAYRGTRKENPVMTILHCDFASESEIQSLAIAEGFKVNSMYIGKETEVNIELQRKVREIISSSDMLVLAGRSAYGHYSAKNKMYDILHKPAVLDSINKLLFVGDGLVLGTGEGARALVDLGFLPHGTAERLENDSINLVASNGKNTAALMPKIRISNNFSPMLTEVNIGNTYYVASGGKDMRFLCDKDTVNELAFSGRIVGQFTDSKGIPTKAYPFNPTGSDMAVASVSSESGKILGFFCLPEKTAYLKGQPSLIKDILKSSAKYFK